MATLIATAPRHSLLDDRNARFARDAALTTARKAQHDRDDRQFLIWLLLVVLDESRAAAAKQFARETRGTNGYAGQHVETLEQSIKDSFQRYESFLRCQTIRAKRISDLTLKGGW